MILAILLLSALSQQDAEAVAFAPDGARSTWSAVQQAQAQHWWEGLSDEQRAEYIKRQKKWRNMDGQRRQKMEERHDALKAQGEEVLASMSAADLKEFGKMDEHSQRRHLHGLARSQKRKGGGRPPRHSLPLDISLREPQIREALHQAHASGWIGDKAAIWLETASVGEAIQVLFSIRKWQFLEKANTEGFWKANNISDEKKSQLIAMPAEHFLREIKRIMRDEHKIWDGNSENRRNKRPRQSSEKR
ncbi:MAG: hypothetical protein CMJ93_04645 [Planctomycetes bacterium]|nr:hypothetical protein [Planctomycetota bacterium]